MLEVDTLAGERPFKMIQYQTILPEKRRLRSSDKAWASEVAGRVTGNLIFSSLKNS